MLLVGLRGCESVLALLLALLSSKGRPTVLQHAFNIHLLIKVFATDQKIKIKHGQPCQLLTASCLTCSHKAKDMTHPIKALNDSHNLPDDD